VAARAMRRIKMNKNSKKKLIFEDINNIIITVRWNKQLKPGRRQMEPFTPGQCVSVRRKSCIREVKHAL
jgi:hypothetical protein